MCHAVGKHITYKIKKIKYSAKKYEHPCLSRDLNPGEQTPPQQAPVAAQFAFVVACRRHMKMHALRSKAPFVAVLGLV